MPKDKIGGKRITNTKTYSNAVKENPKYKKELGVAMYAVQFREGLNGGKTLNVIDFNSDRRTDNKERSLHSLDAYGNMKIYQRTIGGDIYLLTKDQMEKINKKMPKRTELEADREKTMNKIEKLVSQNTYKVIKKKK